MANKTIQEILEEKERRGFFVDGFRLYSPLIGVCYLENANLNGTILVSSKGEISHLIIDTIMLGPDAKNCLGGECMLFPSKAMRDWNKFAWEKYTLVWQGKNRFCFFRDWASRDYTEFYGLEYVYTEGVIKEKVSRHKTQDYSSCPHEQEMDFYRTLYFKCKFHAITTLMENIPSYQKVVTNVKAERLAKAAAKDGNKKDRECLENMARRAMLTEDFVKKNYPVKGNLYYFENPDDKDESYIAVFDCLSDDRKTVFFFRTMMQDHGFIHLVNDMKMSTNCCANFRLATDDEITRFKKAWAENNAEFCEFLKIGKVYTFDMENECSYYGNLVSVNKKKKQMVLSDVRVVSKKETTVESIMTFDIPHCYSLRLATYEEIDRLYRKEDVSKTGEKENCSFQPKQWCLMRDFQSNQWSLCQFSHLYKGSQTFTRSVMYVAVGGLHYFECIPYEGNEKLLGTTDPYTDGKE